MDSITVGYQAARKPSDYSPPTNLLINGQAVTIDQTPITSSPTTPPPTTPRDPDRWNGDLHLVRDDYGHRRPHNCQNSAWNNPAGQTVNVSQTGFTITEMNGAAPAPR